MSVRIIEGRGIAALYDSTTGTAFGPTFTGIDAHDQAVHFLDWLEEDDARVYTPTMLSDEHAYWAQHHLDSEYGELTASAAAHVVTLL